MSEHVDDPRSPAQPRPHRGSGRELAHRLIRLPGAVVVAVLLALLWLYQNLVSPLSGPRCRYYPSCSSYAVGALRRHGAAKGTVLAVARVCRCHPWSAGGLDPVPAPGRWRNDPEPDPEQAGASVLEGTADPGRAAAPDRVAEPDRAPRPQDAPEPQVEVGVNDGATLRATDLYLTSHRDREPAS